jgi:hypothetical protein
MSGKSTMDELFSQSKFTNGDQKQFLDNLDLQLTLDNHDFSIDERLEMIGTCYNKNIRSVIMQVPCPEEMLNFKKCVRKYARTKMRIISYY